MTSNEPVATRAERELEALLALRRSRPRLFWVLVLAAIIVVAWFGYDRLFGIPRLRQEIAERDRRIVLLETQLAPFRALALERFPGAAEGEAIARLATQIEDLRRQFERAQAAIQSFAVEVSVQMKGNWKDGKLPDPSHLLRTAGGRSGALTLLVLPGEERSLDFQDSSGIVVRDLGGGSAVLQYQMPAAPGTWVLGRPKNDIAACRRAEIYLWSVNSASTVDGRLQIQLLKVRFFINGIPSFECVLDQGSTVKLVGDAGGSTSLTWRGHVPVKPT